MLIKSESKGRVSFTVVAWGELPNNSTPMSKPYQSTLSRSTSSFVPIMPAPTLPVMPAPTLPVMPVPTLPVETDNSLPPEVDADEAVRIQVATGRIKQIKCPQKITDTSLEFLSECHGLSSLIIEKCGKISNKGVAAVIDSCKNLTSINMNQCPQLTDDAIRNIPNSLKNLGVFRVSHCPKISYELIGTIIDGCKRLKTLSMGGNAGNPDSVADVLLRSRQITQISLGKTRFSPEKQAQFEQMYERYATGYRLRSSPDSSSTSSPCSQTSEMGEVNDENAEEEAVTVLVALGKRKPADSGLELPAKRSTGSKENNYPIE